MGTETKNPENNAIDSIALLESLGFQRGKGFGGEVWTNCESEWMTQVWIKFSGDYNLGEQGYDATEGFELREFFQWWEKVSSEQHDYDEWQSAMGDEL